MVCSLQSAIWGLQSAVCSLRSGDYSLQMSYTALVPFSIRYHPKNIHFPSLASAQTEVHDKSSNGLATHSFTLITCAKMSILNKLNEFFFGYIVSIGFFKAAYPFAIYWNVKPCTSERFELITLCKEVMVMNKVQNVLCMSLHGNQYSIEYKT